MKVIGDITAKVKPDVTYYNQFLPAKRSKKRKRTTTTKGYEVDQFVVADDDEKEKAQNINNNQIFVYDNLKNIEKIIEADIENGSSIVLSDLNVKFEDPSTTVEDVFKIADAIESNINIITTTSNNIKENIFILKTKNIKKEL